MTIKPVDASEAHRTIFAENSVIELKYQNKAWRKGVILSSSRSNGIVIDLLMDEKEYTYKRIKLYHSIAVSYYYLTKSLKILAHRIPAQLCTLGTNIEYKYKNTAWKNGRIINIAAHRLNETSIEIKKTVSKTKIITMPRSQLIMEYLYRKTIRLSNKIYPFWLSHDGTVRIRELGKSAHAPYNEYHVACYRDGKYLTFYQHSADDAITIKHSEITLLSNHEITSKQYRIKPLSNTLSRNIVPVQYRWEISEDTINASKHLLCHGFVKQHYDEYVTTVIVQLISCFVSNILEDMKSAQHKQAFFTNVVSIKSFKWYLKLYPNGLGQPGELEMFLCLQSLPKQLEFVKVEWQIEVLETNSTYSSRNHSWWYSSDVMAFDAGHLERANYIVNNYYNQDQSVKIADIQSLKQLTFEMKIKYHSVLNTKKQFMKFDEHYYTNPILN